ncbi:HEAT repeat domain-containing protein [Streptomyces chryseus]|uniref:HEAT repeat domain-containing protein n=1 Tax=Streptomyces chryseus TaxID=68186 RepID=UPI00110FABCD|nr:hypothetical protein [Streptomyces chryseus]GGX37255.1 hypothetical protein GCM10010353_60580 [Streptomyces chryseus]
MTSANTAAEQAAQKLAQGQPIASVIDPGDPAAWLALDAAVRELSRYPLHQEPPPERPPRRWLSRLLAPADAEPGVGRTSVSYDTEPGLALALCDADGHVRESALAQVPGGSALLPLIVIRCADWVTAIHNRARKHLQSALPTLTPEELAALAPLMLRVDRRERGTFATGLLEAVLRTPPYDHLKAQTISADRDTRRFAHRIAAAEQVLTPVELARTAAQDPDVVVQNRCAEAALAGVQPDAYDEVLAPLLAARSPQVRAAGVTALRKAERPAQAEPFLADRSPVVRACARYVVRQHDIDPLPLYRAWCAERGAADVPAGAPIGLAECGDRQDARLLWPLTEHPSPAIRSRAVAGLRTLDVFDAVRLIPLLDDPSPAVTRETVTSLTPSAQRIPVDHLVDRLAPDRPRHQRLAATRLLAAQGELRQLRILQTLLRDEDAKVRERAGRTVGAVPARSRP